MPLPTLKRPHPVERELAREYAKRVVLGAAPEQAAAAVGGPAAALELHPEAQRLARAIDPAERELLAATVKTEYALARKALDSRDGRIGWLQSVISGEAKFEGAFGARKEFPPNAKLLAMRLLGQMHADFTMKHEVQVTEQTVFVFKIPDNGRLPAENVVDAPTDDDV